jgi:hypothetical protein
MFGIALTPVSTYAAPWSGILDPSRATDWTYAGVTGGIPTGRTQCGPTIEVYSGSASTINNAIAACGENQYVQLGTGTFTLSSGIGFAGKNNVSLRGNGPDHTILKFSNGNGCSAGNISSYGGLICVGGTSGVWAGDVGTVTNIKNWTAGYAQGTTQLTLDSTSGITAGTIVVIDQCDETTDDGGITNSAYGSNFLNENQTRGRHDKTGCSVSGLNRSLEEFHKVVSVDNGAQLTITPPVMMPTWRASQSPQLWWLGTSSNTFIQGVGIEALTVDGQSVSTMADIMFENAYDGWVDNVRIVGFNRGAISYRQAAHITVQRSYIYRANSFTAESYGNDILSASNLLIIDNICQFLLACKLGPAPGSVFAYNYLLDFPFNLGNVNALGIFGTHDAGGGVELYEGNQTDGFISDFPHGQSPLQVMFRNHFRGVDERSGVTGPYRYVFDLQSFSRGYSVVGNVLGLSGFHTAYECDVGGGVCPGGDDQDHMIYRLGANRGGSTPNDPLVKTTLLRWGNYDTVNKSSRFLSSEIPSSGVRSLNGNFVPANQTLPASFFLASQPAWWVTTWGTPAWPSIGPDVTGGDHPDPGLNGHVYKIPARLCYENSAVDSTYSVPQRDRGFLLFNATACYPAGASSPPGPPQNLAVQ